MIFDSMSQSEITATRDLQRRGLFDGIVWLPCEDGKCRACWRCRKERQEEGALKLWS
jgi:hypothetical protein